MNEQNPLTLLILKGLPNPSEDRKQKREGTIIMSVPSECNRSSKEQLRLWATFWGPPYFFLLNHPLPKRAKKEATEEKSQDQPGGDRISPGTQRKKEREWMSAEKGFCFGCHAALSHLILPQAPFCIWENRHKEAVKPLMKGKAEFGLRFSLPPKSGLFQAIILASSPQTPPPRC